MKNALLALTAWNCCAPVTAMHILILRELLELPSSVEHLLLHLGALSLLSWMALLPLTAPIATWLNHFHIRTRGVTAMNLAMGLLWMPLTLTSLALMFKGAAEVLAS